MSRSHVARPAQAAPAKPAPQGTVPQPAAPLNAAAHAHFGHHFSQIASAPAEDAAPIQREAEDDADGEEMQLKAEGGVPARPNVPAAGGVGGSPLPTPVRSKMEASFGHSFADVRVHSGDEAKTVGALAYTRGTDIHFQPGLYDPSSAHGQELLGHELAHVVQQSAGRVASPSGAGGTAPINADMGLEAEADAMGRQAAQGESAPVTGAGGGIQRKAMSDAPIQREEDEDAEEEVEAAPKYYQMDAPKRPNEFLPNRRVTPPANNSPERSSVRANATNAQRNQDTPKVTTFRNRMAGEMTAQKNMLATNDEAAQFPVHPLAKPGPAGWEGFQTQQRLERDRELGALGDGKTTAGGSIVESDGAPNSWSPRPAPTTTPMAPGKYVTPGTVAGKTAYNGDGDKVKTLSDPSANSLLGWLEDSLNNPYSDADRERQGMVDRQQSIMATAEKADPLMNEIVSTGKLSKHVHTSNRPGNLGGGVTRQAGTSDVLKNGNKVYAFGAKEFGNRPVRSHLGNAADFPERALPSLTNPLATDVITNANGNVSHQGRYHEADVDPAKIRNTYGYHQNINYEQRNAERLLYTSASSKAETPNGKGGTSSQTVDYRFHVTNDHYQNAVPITPVEQDYAVNHPYQSPYMDTPLAGKAFGPTRSSLDAHNTKEAQRAKQAVGDDGMLRMQASESLRDQAGADAKQASRVRANDERQRNTMDDLIEGEAYNEAEKAATKASYNRNADEMERVKMAGVLEDFETDQAYKGAHEAALKANAKREAEEEARTQADLKAFAPSDSIQSMYGMGKGGAEKWAAQEMEQQHLGVQQFLKSGEATEAAPPMSEAASAMYG